MDNCEPVELVDYPNSETDNFQQYENSDFGEYAYVICIIAIRVVLSSIGIPYCRLIY